MRILHNRFWAFLILTVLAGCTQQQPNEATLPPDVYFDKVRGAWQATLIANHTGLPHEGQYLTEPSSESTIDLVFLDEWSTDDDTLVEWVDLHILETHGLDPTYTQIRDEWVDHLNNDIWVSTLRARQLMDEGVLPPETGSAALNPKGVWSIDAQLQTEVFGLIAPGLPDEASRRAVTFAKVTNSGLAVDASAFYTTMYAEAFFESDVPILIASAQSRFAKGSQIYSIVAQVRAWHRQHPDEWRITRRLIRDAYDTDPEWWASQVNFASTIMALLYGEGDLPQTMTIAALAGWDADNNVTTSAGLLGIIYGYQGLPESFRVASQIYYNEDVSGDLPKYQTVIEITRRTQSLAEQVIVQAGGRVEEGLYIIPVMRLEAGEQR